MSDKMREEFEDWCDLNGFASDRYELSDLGEAYKHLCGEYVIRESRFMWQAWQASRAAITVDLPSSYNVEQEDYKRWVMDCLDDAGINCI